MHADRREILAGFKIHLRRVIGNVRLFGLPVETYLRGYLLVLEVQIL
jgi:hypothetical protein